LSSSGVRGQGRDLAIQLVDRLGQLLLPARVPRSGALAFDLDACEAERLGAAPALRVNLCVASAARLSAKLLALFHLFGNPRLRVD
jgi:hypothetical protein